MSNTASEKVEGRNDRIALTSGEPAGIGPDLAVLIAQKEVPARLSVFADADVLARRAALLKLPLEITAIGANDEPPPHRPGHLFVVASSVAQPVTPGRLDPANANYVLQTIDAAVSACLADRCDALVTAPVNKAAINDAGIAFTGHTEYIAGRCGNAQPVMMLMSDALRVALVTTHLPLAHVPRAVTAERIERVVRTVTADLRSRFGIDSPQLLLCGLNPHAGEGGYLGDEEQRIIGPAVAGLRADGISIRGPVPADTAFTPGSLDGIDAVIAMYHDQGLPALKALGFGNIVNVTLGLPVIRTSVDHGTALDLAGTGRADPGSLIAALECALRLARGASMTRETAHAAAP